MHDPDEAPLLVFVLLMLAVVICIAGIVILLATNGGIKQALAILGMFAMGAAVFSAPR